MRIKLKATQYPVITNKKLVNDIKNDMINNKYDFNDKNNIIGVQIYKNYYFITEGHHRTYAAILATLESDKNYIQILLNHSLKYKINKKLTYYRSFPKSWKLKLEN